MIFAQRKNVTNWDDVPVVMDMPFAARILGVTNDSLVKRCQRGTFPGFKEGKLWRVTKEALLQHIEANSVQQTNKVIVLENDSVCKF